MRTAVPVPIFNGADLRESVFAGEYVASSRPCVIKNAIGHWGAAKKWRNKEYLKYRCGHHKVFYFPHENHVTEKRMLAGRRRMGFAQAIDKLHAAETDIATLGLNRDMPELLADLGNFPFFTKAAPPFFFPSARYFIYRNAGTAWHYHSFDETLMCQVVGSKKIGLLHVDTPYHKALSDIFLKEDYYDDASVFGGLGVENLRWFSATLEENDALYIPPLWWHGVVPVSDSFGLTAALTWQSPPHVIAGTLRMMAAGTVDMARENTFVRFQGLRDAAHFLGLERELAMALRRLDERAVFATAL